jgi:hypothetical protein
VGMGKKIFLAQRTDGFGERLRAILNAMAFSDYYGLDFKFNYKEREGGLREFHSVGSLDSIFSKIFIDTYHISDEILKNCDVVDGRYFNVVSVVKKDKYYNITQELNLEFFPMLKKIFDSIEFDKIFSKIDFSKDLVVAKNKANIINLDKPFIAIHLRAGDIVYGKYRFMNRFIDKAMPYTLAFELIEKFKNEGNDILLFGQDNEFCNYLVKKYKVKFAGNLVPCEFNDEQKALFDITLMSRCEKIIAGNSGFSILASMIGGVERVDPNVIYSKEKSSEIGIKILKSHLGILNLSKLQIAYACLYSLTINKDSIKDEDYLYLVDFGFKNDSSNYFFILLKIIFLYKTKDVKEAEILIFNYISNNSFNKEFCYIASKLYGNANNRKTAIHDDIKYIKEYADADYPMASFLMLISNYNKNSKKDTLKYTESYLKFKKFKTEDLLYADKVLTDVEFLI